MPVFYRGARASIACTPKCLSPIHPIFAPVIYLWMEQHERHARTLALPDFDQEALERLRKAHLLVVGAGGLGSATLPLLAAQEVGQIDIIDPDSVSLSNLPRQLLYCERECGQEKAPLAAARAEALNPSGRVRAFTERLDDGWLTGRGGDYDLVVDCTDNFPTRTLLDHYCATHHLPLVWGAVEGYIGQVSFLHGRRDISLGDLFGELPETRPLAEGVYPPLVQVIGGIMAGEALAWLALGEASLDGVLCVYDARKVVMGRYEL